MFDEVENAMSSRFGFEYKLFAAQEFDRSLFKSIIFRKQSTDAI